MMNTVNIVNQDMLLDPLPLHLECFRNFSFFAFGIHRVNLMDDLWTHVELDNGRAFYLVENPGLPCDWASTSIHLEKLEFSVCLYVYDCRSDFHSLIIEGCWDSK